MRPPVAQLRCDVGQSYCKKLTSFQLPHIAPVREGLFNLIKGLPPTLNYEPGTIVAEGDFVIVHGRFSHFGLPVNWIAADIVRIKDDALVEHWDVIQEEATRERSKSGQPMFGGTFPTYASAR